MSPLEIDFERYRQRIAELEARIKAKDAMIAEWRSHRLELIVRAEKAETELAGAHHAWELRNQEWEYQHSRAEKAEADLLELLKIRSVHGNQTCGTVQAEVERLRKAHCQYCGSPWFVRGEPDNEDGGGRESGGTSLPGAGAARGNAPPAAVNPAAPDTSGEASPTRVASPPRQKVWVKKGPLGVLIRFSPPPVSVPRHFADCICEACEAARKERDDG